MHWVLLAPERSAPPPASYRYWVSRLLQYETSTLGDTVTDTLRNVAKVVRFIRYQFGKPSPHSTVSFNLIKEHAFELFYDHSKPDEERLEELTKLFMTSPTLIRKHRNPPRYNPSSHRILGFWKR